LSYTISDPPEKQISSTPEPGAAPARPSRKRFSSAGVITLFVLIGLSLLLFSEQIVVGLTQVSQARAAQQARAASPTARSASATPGPHSTPIPTPTPPSSPFSTPGNAAASELQLPAAHYVIYQTTTHIALVSTTDNSIVSVNTPDYLYSQAVRPILTPGGQLLYSGTHGIWLTDLFDQQVTQVAPIDSSVEVASLALSQDGKIIAWSTEPVNDTGQVNLYAGPLTSPQLINQQSVLNCPCFRIFGFLNGTDTAADNTLLLTDDRGSAETLQYGLWSLDISTPSATPQLIMDEGSQQGPLALMPYSNTLLYAPYEGAVPVPGDGSVPSDIAALSYPNSLSIAPLNGTPLDQSNAQVVLPGQKNQASSAQHWVTTPTFSPDGHTLAYIEFSSDTQDPYDRHSALYTISINGSDAQAQVSHPQLIATSTSLLLELGPWLNSHVVTLYADGALYALDVQSDALTRLASTGGYARILGITGTGLT
jgi:hypothetical protein